MTDQKPNDELPKELINDAEFVALMEKEMREDEARELEDELQKKRLWHRLEGSIKSDEAPQRQRSYWPWALVAAVLLGLIPFLSNQEQDQFKGSETKAPAKPVELVLERENGTFKTSLVPFNPAESEVALVMDGEPYDVLWQGNASSGSWPVPADRLRPGRVCAISGKDASDVAKKVNLIRELKQIPSDAPCGVLSPPSE